MNVSARPYPVRMHERDGSLYHLWRNKWRRIGKVGALNEAFERYREIEENLVRPEQEATREARERKKAATREARDRKKAEAKEAREQARERKKAAAKEARERKKAAAKEARERKKAAASKAREQARRDERELVRLFRELAPETRARVLNVLKGRASEHPGGSRPADPPACPRRGYYGGGTRHDPARRHDRATL